MLSSTDAMYMSREGPSKSPIQFGRYEIARHPDGRPFVLGSGSTGKTYKAVHTLMGNTVALKVMHENLVEDPELKRRFFKEARAIASLKHPHIAQLVDCDETDGALFYAMEYCDGGDLEKFATTRGPLPEETVLHLGRQAARALAHVHDKGYLHRDLKPSNLMLAMVPGKNEANLKVIDFGLVKALGETGSTMTQRGQFQGTRLYTSPEQLQHEDLDERTDVFALGMTLWFLLEGKMPLQASNASEITAQRLSGTSIAGEMSQRIHPAIRALLAGMMQPDREKRTRNMHAVLQGIEECLAQLHRGTSRTRPGPAQATHAPATSVASHATSAPRQLAPPVTRTAVTQSAPQQNLPPAEAPPPPVPETSAPPATAAAPQQAATPPEEPAQPLPAATPQPSPAVVAAQVTIRSIPVPLHQKFEMLEDRGDVHGDLGITCCARRVSTGDLVQLTQIQRGLATDNQTLRELDSIVNLAGRCPGRFIIRPNAMIRFQDHLVLIEELVDGLSLLTVLKYRQKIPLLEAAPILAQLVEACDQAIEHGLTGLDLTVHRLTLQFPHMMGARIDMRAAQKLLERPLAQWPHFVLRVEPDYEASYLGVEADLPCRFARLLYHMLSGMPAPASAMGGRTGYIAGLGEEGNRLLGKVISGEVKLPDCLSLLTRLWQMESLPLAALSPGKQARAAAPQA
ncbi:MAG TPA: protein kinase [Prosthecobacter sp.]